MQSVVPKVGKSSKSKSHGVDTRKNFDFSLYIRQVLKQVHPDTGISGVALATMDNIVQITITKIVNQMNILLSHSGAKTASAREVQSGVKIVLPGELRAHAISESTKAVSLYSASLEEDDETKKPKDEKKPIQRKTRAGLTFNITRVERFMVMGLCAKRKRSQAAVYMAATVEYLCAEILELAGNAAREFNKVRITPRHIKLAIGNDVELQALYNNTIIGGGVIPRYLPSEDKSEKKSVKSVKKTKDAPQKSATKKVSNTKKVEPKGKVAASKNVAKDDAKKGKAKDAAKKGKGNVKDTPKKVAAGSSVVAKKKASKK
jgi:histone H3/H4